MSEWNKTVLETLDTVVEYSTEKLVRPAHKAARFSVYSIVIFAMVSMILLFLTVAAFRATTLVLPVYGAYLAWGGIFILIGALLWAKK